MKKVLAVTLLATVFSAPATASDSGFFGAVDVQTWGLDKLNGGSNPSTGFRIGGGYHFTQKWGVEVNYAESGNGTLNGQNFKANSLQVAAINTWHINDTFGLFAKMGLSAFRLSGNATTGCSCSNTRVVGGIGGQYNINDQIGIRLEYDDFGGTTDSRHVSNISLGIVNEF